MAAGAERSLAEDLGRRPIGALLWTNCSHTTASVALYGVYALTNAWFVARGVGEVALAAVNIVAPLLLLIGAIATTVGVGGASLVSRRLGAGSPEGAATAAGTAFGIYWAASIVFAAAGLIWLEPLLRLMGATDATLPDALAYGTVVFAAAPVATGFSAIVRAEGAVRFSMMMWLSAVAVQITLDPLLIFGLDMGVVGAGLGTAAGQAVSAALALWFFFWRRGRVYEIRARHLVPEPRTAASVVSIGAPSFLVGLGTTVLAALVNASLAVAGAAAVAGFAVAARVQTFVVMPQTGMTQGMQPIVGFNAGRGLDTRVERTRVLSTRATVLVGLVAAVVVVALADPLATAFLGPDHEWAPTAIRIVALGFVLSGVAPLISAYFQSLGRPTPSYAISIGTVVAIKIPLVLALSPLGPVGIWAALPLGEALSAAAAWAVLAMQRRRAATKVAMPCRGD